MTSVPPPPGQDPHQQPQHPSGQPVMPVSGPHATMMRPPPGHGALMVTLQGNGFTAGLTPTVQIDGYRVPASFGPNFYPLRPGRHRIDVHTQWMRRYGQAGIEVDLHEGQQVPVFYAVPWHQFTTGSIGHEQQSRKGLGAMLAIIAVTVLVILLCCIGGALLA